MLLVLSSQHPQPRKIEKAAELIQAGEILSYPTDTGYGFGCDAHQLKAVDRLFRLTNRPHNKPASFLCRDFKQLAQYAYIDDQAYRVARRIMPGPYTLILKATKLVARQLHGKRREVGIRVPDHPVILSILDKLEGPILNVTAHDHNDQYLDDPRLIEDIWGQHFGAVVDCDLVPETPSTVIDLTGVTPEVIRVGSGDPDVFF